MTDFITKCAVCQALLDEEDLFCVNCGTEAPPGHAGLARKTMLSTHNFTCENCGASMSYDATSQNLRCPFCSSEKIHAEQDAKTLSPDAVVRFHINREQALAALKKFMGNSIWRPSDLAETALITKLTAIYVPFWVFSATTYSYWTADTNQTPPGARANWYPVSGEHTADYQGVLVGASGALTPAETQALCPFDLSLAVPAEEIDLQKVLYEPFRVQRKYARPQAIAGFELLEMKACRALVPGSARNVHVALRLEGLEGRPILLPIWIMAYQYQQQTYRFVLNGQNGKSIGDAPKSTTKIMLAVVITAFVIFWLIAVIAFCAGAPGVR